MTDIGEPVGVGLILSMPDKSGSLTVKVVDDCEGKGVEGAVVTVNRQEKKTNASGTASFSGLPIGDHGVSVQLHQKDCDYVEFGVTPSGGIDVDAYDDKWHPFEFKRKAVCAGSVIASVIPGSAQAEVELPVYRHLDTIKVKRNNVSVGGESGSRVGSDRPPSQAEKAGVAERPAVELGHWWIEIGARSWGWWPKEGEGVEDFLDDTGELNQGRPKVDPYHGDPADREYTVVLSGDCRTEQEIVSDIDDFVKSWIEENHSRYSVSRGIHCQTLQIDILRECGLDHLRPKK